MQSFYEEISRKKDSVSFIQRDCNWWYLSIITDRNISNAYFIRNFFIVFVFLSSLYNHLEKWWVLKGCAYNPPLPTPIHSPHPFPPLPTPIHPPHPVPPPFPPPFTHPTPCPDIHLSWPRLSTKTKVVGRFNCIVTCDSCNLLPQNVAPICSV